MSSKERNPYLEMSKMDDMDPGPRLLAPTVLWIGNIFFVDPDPTFNFMPIWIIKPKTKLIINKFLMYIIEPQQDFVNILSFKKNLF